LAKKDKDKQVLLAEDHTWIEYNSDSNQEINANMVFMAQIEKVLSNSEASSSSSDDKLAEVRNKQEKDKIGTKPDQIKTKTGSLGCNFEIRFGPLSLLSTMISLVRTPLPKSFVTGNHFNDHEGQYNQVTCLMVVVHHGIYRGAPYLPDNKWRMLDLRPFSLCCFFLHTTCLHGSDGIDKLTDVVGFHHLQDKMKIVFTRTHSKDECFIGIVRDLCRGIRLSLSKNRRLISELEPLGQPRAEVGRRLKAGYADDMDETESNLMGVFPLHGFKGVDMDGCLHNLFPKDRGASGTASIMLEPALSTAASEGIRFQQVEVQGLRAYSLLNGPSNISDVDEVFSIWKAFRGNTHDLGSFEEETDKIMNQHQDSSRFKVSELGDRVTIYTRRHHTSSSDGFTTSFDGVSPHRLNSDLEDSTL
nr:hypothetical protein [Tanacetum cinerariifolium]